jgi:Leucine-rich repeat (LRR) protein
MILTLLLSLFLFFVFDSQSALLPAQFQALQTLYDETNGTHWNFAGYNVTAGKGWDFDTNEDPCADNWNGIICNLSQAECAISPCELHSLVLDSVGMVGTLPDTITDLGSNIHTLSLSGNDLFSSLPSSIGDLYGLHFLSLGGNRFTGQLPSSIAQLQKLQILDLKANLFSQVIPLEVINAPFTNLIVFYVGENQFSGPIPTLFNASKIQQIYITKNEFSGTIPSSFYSFTHLFYLGIATNNLIGTLSTEIGNLKALKNFYAGYNSIESTIPSELGQLSLLEYFEMSKNKLYGSIPKEIGYLTNLLVLELNINDLTGTLAPEISNLSLMHTLYLHENSFQGTIPHEYTRLSSLQLCILSYNELTGTIPPAISSLTNLYDFSVYNNRLSGLVPGTLFLIPRLEKLLLQNNALTGFQMDNVILQDLKEEDISVMYLDISNNRFHGTVPSDIFSKMNHIVSLAATKNCFTGSLPESICESKSLEVLALDGLASGDGCRDKIFYPFSLFDSYLITPLQGDIPHCYWSMPNLTVLHLSGNGLGGSILSDIPAGKLQNISLSFNRLTGSIPKYLMEQHFVELSLSNNKLQGMFDTLHFDESAGAGNRSILDISTNRLSGFVPLHICDVADLSALEGNLFDCNRHHSLPGNDPYHNEYVCASKQLTQPLFVCILILGSFVILSLYAVALLSRSTKVTEESEGAQLSWSDQAAGYLRNMIVWTSLEELECDIYLDKQTKMIYAPNLKVFVSILRMLRKTFIILSVFLVVVCVPLYYFIKNSFDGYYSTHEKQYTWTYSIAYMSGTASAILIMTIFCIGCFFVTFALNIFVNEHKIKDVMEDDGRDAKETDTDDAVNINGSDNVKEKRMATLRSVCSYGMVISCNIVLYILINSGYIFLLLSASLDSSMKLLANFGMAIIKLFWNLFIVPTSVEYTAQVLGDDYHHLKWMIAFLLLFNNIAAPSLATAFTDDKCYEQLIAPSCEIDAFYELPVCNIYELDVSTGLRDCYEYIKLSIETPFNAPFIYNYQCSSSIIVNYVPVFLFAYAFLALMFPLVCCVLTHPAVYVSFPQRLRDIVPTLLIPPETLQSNPQSPHVPVIRPDRIIATLMSHFAVLLTFGIASPILGFVIGVTVCILTYMHQMIIGRYLAYHSGTKEAENNVTYCGNIDGAKFSGGLEHACTQFLSGLPACLWTIIVGSNLLFSFIVFDSVGDKKGFTPAIWSSTLTIIVLPLLVYSFYKIAMYERLKTVQFVSEHDSASSSSSSNITRDEAEIPLLLE